MATFSYFSTVLTALMILFFTSSTHAATFNILNRCSYPVWAAASFGGGRRLNQGQSWPLFVNAGTRAATIWGRTNCNFDGSGRGSCQTGDCAGFLECRAPASGRPPLTLAEFTLNGANNLDYYDISVIDGYNIPMEFSPTTGGCRNLRCTDPRCPDAYLFPNDVKTRTCPAGGNYRIVFCP